MRLPVLSCAAPGLHRFVFRQLGLCLPDAGSEATEVAMATSWGDAVSISFGGDAEQLRSRLVMERPRRFLFTGHADLDLNDGELRLGFTKPGGTLEAVDTELIAQMLGANSVANDGPLEVSRQ